MLKMPVMSGLGQVVPMPHPYKSRSAPSVVPLRTGPVRDTVKFGIAINPNTDNILEDPLLVNFNVPVTSQTAAQLTEMLVKAAEQKRQLGGSIKLLLNTPGGEVYSGLQTVQVIKRLGVPVDAIIMGGQAASMGSLLFMASTGRRILTPDASLLIHQPRAMEVGGTLSDLKLIVKDMEGLHKRMQRLIAEKSGLPLAQVEEITNVNADFRVLPLRALKMGLATHVLLENNRAITKDALKSLDDAEIDRRDQDNDFVGLKTEAFDPQIFDPQVIAQLKARQQQGGGSVRRGGGGAPPGGVSGFQKEEFSFCADKPEPTPSGRPRIMWFA